MSQEETDLALFHCDCYVHTRRRFVNKIVENAVARRNSLCPLLGIPSMAPPIKLASQAEHKVMHRRIDDEAVVEEMYKLGRQLGQGSFGVVLEADDVKTKKKWAIKIVNKEKAGSMEVTLLEREVAILKKVKHDHIIHLQEIFETAKKMYLVMELCNCGDLKTLLDDKGPFSEVSTRHVIKDLSDVIVYLHKNGIVHRDLKLDNILIASCDEPDSKDPLYDIRLTDFGLSVVKEGEGSDHMLQAACGTPVYMAPEVILHHEYSQQCDNWSIGVILFALLSSHFPFVGDSEDHLFEQIAKGELDFTAAVWLDKSEAVINLLKNVLVVDPALRYTAREIESHPWTMGSTDINSSVPTNVLAMMKDYARMSRTNDIEDSDNEMDETPNAAMDDSQKAFHPDTNDSSHGVSSNKSSAKSMSGLSKTKIKSAPSSGSSVAVSRAQGNNQVQIDSAPRRPNGKVGLPQTSTKRTSPLSTSPHKISDNKTLANSKTGISPTHSAKNRETSESPTGKNIEKPRINIRKSNTNPKR